MSGRTIKTSSDAASKPTQTDWARLKSLSDEDIDSAVADDVDAYVLETEVLGRNGSAYRYEVYQTVEARFGWRLVSSVGRIFATSDQDFASKREALTAIKEVRSALLGGQQLAA